MDWLSLLWIVIVWVLSAIPLNIAVKLLRGKSTLIKAILVNLVVAVLTALINGFFDAHTSIALIVGFIVLLLVYKVMFSMGWLRSFLAWILQFVIIAIVIVVLALFGLSLHLL
ncbi:hypothetical protein JXB31_04435 [Candidatus Woesearchaeota archaeon]|nr:hypothetical protein [Candidatus Woesearchaeota archaeon]